MVQHLRVEENPILKMAHLEAASILLVGPTLKKFNDRGNLIKYYFSAIYIGIVGPLLFNLVVYISVKDNWIQLLVL